jgi:hypothetical protein
MRTVQRKQLVSKLVQMKCAQTIHTDFTNKRLKSLIQKNAEDSLHNLQSVYSSVLQPMLSSMSTYIIQEQQQQQHHNNLNHNQSKGDLHGQREKKNGNRRRRRMTMSMERKQTKKKKKKSGRVYGDEEKKIQS